MISQRPVMKTAVPLVAAAAMLVAACAQDERPRAGVPARHEPSISIGTAGPLPPLPARTPANYRSVKIDRPLVALTFDDGPHPVLTPRLLDILRQHGVRATFYVIGRSVDAHPDIARRIVAEGHEIANHTYTHPHLTQIGAARLDQEIIKTTDAIVRATGRRPTNMRPPYGSINARVEQSMLNKHGLDVIMWSVDPLDWRRPGASVVAQRLVEGATPGGILLAHDIHPGTIEAMPSAIAQLKAKGYGFATVSQLLALQHATASRAPMAQAVQEDAAGAATP